VVYRTKVDFWIAAMLLFGLTAMVLATATTGDWKVMLLGLGVWALVFPIAWPCDYRFVDNVLIVRSGLIKYRIPLAEVEKVEPSRNPLSAPAYSLDRLLIRYGKRSMLISPKERGAFLEDFAKRAGLKRYGDQLVREKY